MTFLQRAPLLPSPLRGGPTRGEAPSGVGVAGVEPGGGSRALASGGVSTRLTSRSGHSTPTPLGLAAESVLPARGREERLRFEGCVNPLAPQAGRGGHLRLVAAGLDPAIRDGSRQALPGQGALPRFG